MPQSLLDQLLVLFESEHLGPQLPLLARLVSQDVVLSDLICHGQDLTLVHLVEGRAWLGLKQLVLFSRWLYRDLLLLFLQRCQALLLFRGWQRRQVRGLLLIGSQLGSKLLYLVEFKPVKLSAALQLPSGTRLSVQLLLQSQNLLVPLLHLSRQSLHLRRRSLAHSGQCPHHILKPRRHGRQPIEPASLSDRSPTVRTVTHLLQTRAAEDMRTR